MLRDPLATDNERADAMADHSGPAFPCAEIRGPNGDGICEAAPGMSLRDWFAGQALPAVTSALSQSNGVVPEYVLRDLFGRDASGIRREQIAAGIAYSLADAMLERRNRK